MAVTAARKTLGVLLIVCATSPGSAQTSVSPGSAPNSVSRQEFDALKKQLAESQQRLKDLESRFKTAPAGSSNDGQPVGGGVLVTPDTTCPSNTVAVGIRWWGSPGSTRYCIGCLSGIQVLCKPLT